MIVSLIAAVDENYALGKNNALLCHLPADLAYFKTTTMGKPIIMGRKTYESIGKPLPGRQNLVLTHNPLKIEGVTIIHSISEGLGLIQDAAEVMIIGGATVFEQAMEIANRIYLTIIHHQFDADVYFPQLDKTSWRCVDATFRARDEHNPYDMTFIKYER